MSLASMAASMPASRAAAKYSAGLGGSGELQYLAKPALANERSESDLLGIDEMHACRRSAAHACHLHRTQRLARLLRRPLW